VTDDNSFGNVTYSEKEQTWYFKAKRWVSQTVPSACNYNISIPVTESVSCAACRCSKENKDGSLPYDIDLTLKVYSPGYIPATPMGVE
jgi:hypothetical protein